MLSEKELAFSVNLGGQIARRAFRSRGDNSEIHIRELHLADMIRAAVEIALSEHARLLGKSEGAAGESTPQEIVAAIAAANASVTKLRAALDSIRAFASERTHSIYCEHIAEMAADAIAE